MSSAMERRFLAEAELGLTMGRLKEHQDEVGPSVKILLPFYSKF